MNCAHCGSAFAILDPIDGERFCSEEHRAAYICAMDSVTPNRAQNNGVKLVGRRASNEPPEPTRPAGFIRSEFQEMAQRRAYLACEPMDLPLGVVAPTSNLREAFPSPHGRIAMRMPSVRSWATSLEADPFQVSIRSRPQFPKLPASIGAVSLPMTGTQREFVKQLSGPNRQSVGRWALLAVSFVGIALATHFTLGGRSEPPTTPANSSPVASFEDFSSGLGQWGGAESGTKPWTLPSSKGAAPHSLALFKPSTGITDYRLEFTADVEKNGISWAIRALDAQNYQALQVWQKKTGTETQLWLTRYTVKAGKEGPRTQVPLQIMLPAQSIWLVRLEAIGDSCTLWIENQIANAWSENSVAGGSIGFFAGKGDQFVLKRVRITPE